MTAPLVRRACWVVLPLAGLAAARVQLTETAPDAVVTALVAGLTACALALVCWQLRPAAVTGPALVAWTGWVLVSPIALLGGAGWIVLAWLADSVSAAAFAHAVLSWPTGRLRAGADRVFGIAAYAGTTLFALAEIVAVPPAAKGGCPPSGCPPVPPLVAAGAVAVSRVQHAVAAGRTVLAGAFAVLVIRAVATARPRQRRLLLPVAAAGLVLVVRYLLEQAEALGLTLPAGLAPLTADETLPLLAAGAAAAFAGAAWAARGRRGRVADALVELAGSPPASAERLLATALRDPGLRLGRWDRDRQEYLDGDRRVLDPAMAPAATRVDGADGPLAVLVHDPGLLAEPALLASAVAATRLAAENGQLTEQVRAQLAEVRESRRRLLAATDEERRRLERDLHDGAQQRLLAAGLAIGLARREVEPGSPAAQLLAEADQELRAALDELRELARGLHPALLADAGLAAAVAALGRRCALRVDLGPLPAGRLPRPVESAAYFVVSEALQNAVKHSAAARVRVAAQLTPGSLRVCIEDDGAGGADPGGSGLRGLRDRVEALDGTLTVDSEPGSGTRVEAVLPCG